MFQKAIKHESKLRLAIAGPSGGGKTYTALAIGTALAGNGEPGAASGRVAVIDTEHGSASKYADIFSFDTLNLRPPFHPDRFIDAIEAAQKGGYDVVIIDSLSHAWNGEGGLLEVVDEIGKRMKTANTFAAWKDATPIQNRLIEAIVGADVHIIATMRSKQEYVLEQVERNGRFINQPKKVGMAPIQRDSMEYEFDVYLDMDIDNNAIVQKTRCSLLTNRVFSKPGADVAGILREWLHGESAPPKPQNQPVAQRQPAPAQQEPPKQNGRAAQAKKAASTVSDATGKSAFRVGDTVRSVKNGKEWTVTAVFDEEIEVANGDGQSHIVSNDKVELVELA